MKGLLIIHGLLTAIAGIVLIVSPSLIPTAAGIKIQGSAFFICYLLGAAELAFAYLSFAAISLRSDPVLRVIVIAFIVFHLLTAVVEFLYFRVSGSLTILYNAILRVLIAGLFYYFGLLRTKGRSEV